MRRRAASTPTTSVGRRSTKSRAVLIAETFGELAEQFIEDDAKPRKRTWRIDQLDIERELSPWPYVKGADIKRRDVIALLKSARAIHDNQASTDVSEPRAAIARRRDYTPV